MLGIQGGTSLFTKSRRVGIWFCPVVCEALRTASALPLTPLFLCLGFRVAVCLPGAESKSLVSPCCL